MSSFPCPFCDDPDVVIERSVGGNAQYRARPDGSFPSSTNYYDVEEYGPLRVWCNTCGNNLDAHYTVVDFHTPERTPFLKRRAPRTPRDRKEKAT